LIFANTTVGQQSRIVRGTVSDAMGPLIGASATVKGTTIKSMTNIEGQFSINVPDEGTALVIGYVGMVTKEVDIRGKSSVTVVLESDMAQLSEVVVVGYGTQKRESVVAAVTQTTGKVLERAGGVSSIGAALTGNVPGVITSASTGMPGEEDPQILIRGRSTWNNTSPLILVD